MAEEHDRPDNTPAGADAGEQATGGSDERLLSDDDVVTMSEPADMLRGDSPAPPPDEAAPRLKPERIKREQAGSLLDQAEETLGGMSNSALVWTGVALFLVLVVLALAIANTFSSQNDIVAIITSTPSATRTLPAPVDGGDPGSTNPGVISENAVEVMIAVAGADESLTDEIRSKLRAASVNAGDAIVLNVQYAGESIPTSVETAQTLRAEQEADIFIWPEEADGLVRYRVIASPELSTGGTQRTELGITADTLPDSLAAVPADNEAAVDAAVFNTVGQVAFLTGDYQAAASLFSFAQQGGLLSETGTSNLNALNLYLALSRYAISGDNPDVLQNTLAAFSFQPNRLLNELGFTIPGDPSGAAAQFEALLTENPEDLTALTGLARVNILLGNYSAAAEYAATSVQIDPSNADGLLLQAVAAYLSTDYLFALERLDTALDANPEDVRAFAMRALAHMALGQYELALSDFDAALALETDIVLLGRAIALDQLGDVVATLALYQSFFGDYATQADADAAVEVMLTARIDSLGAEVQQEQEAASATQSAAQAQATLSIQQTAAAGFAPTEIPFANEGLEDPQETEEP